MAINVISRNDAAALIPEDISREIIQGAVTQSIVLRKFRRLPNMPTNKTRMPVLASLPTAYWVDGDTGQKQTTKMAWDNKYIEASEIAVIVPISEAVLDDSDYDIWGEVKPRIEEAFGVAIDAAALFGTNKPAVQPADLISWATAAGNTVDLPTVDPDLVELLGGPTGVMAKVEADGFDVNGFAGHISMKAKFRGLRDENGGLLYQPSLTAGTPNSLYGQTIDYPGDNGAWDVSKALLVAGDWSKAAYAMRQDMTYKVLDQAIIQNADGTIAYNLAQQDMVALRCVMRLGWVFANPINRMQQTEVNRCPFAVLKQGA